MRDSLAIVEDRLADLDGETSGAIKAVIGGIGWRASVRLESDVGPDGRRWAWRWWRRARFRC